MSAADIQAWTGVGLLLLTMAGGIGAILRSLTRMEMKIDQLGNDHTELKKRLMDVETRVLSLEKGR